MAYVTKITAGGNSSMLVGSSLYGNCTTAAATAAKAVTISGFDTLVNGVTVHVRFANSNTVASPTLNVSSTGAKPIYRYGTTAPSTSAATSWNAGAVVSLTYSTDAVSTGAWVMNDFLNNTYSTSDFAAASHAHGSITSDGKITDTAVALASGDSLVFIDSSASSVIKKTTITFDGSTATKALTQKGTFETFNNYSHPTSAGNKHIPSGGSSGQFLKYSASGTAVWDSPFIVQASQPSGQTTGDYWFETLS